MRGHKWKMLAAAMSVTEITSREFALATGLPSAQTVPYATTLVDEGYLKLVREEPPERGGRPLKVYAWTKKRPSGHGGAAADALDSMWGRSDPLTFSCFHNMVRCREEDDARACAV
jgi:hypothetical protein